MSSLAYIKQLDVDYVKIDRSFITNITDDYRDEAVIKSMLVLCNNLNKKVVVEGIETKAQANKIIALGCDLAQGFYFGKPMPQQEITAVLKSQYKNSA